MIKKHLLNKITKISCLHIGYLRFILLDSVSSVPASTPNQGNCVMFLIYSHTASPDRCINGYVRIFGAQP